MNKKMIFVIAVLFIFAAFTKAQTTKTYVGPQLGFQKAASADNGKFLFGGALRAKLSPSLGVEASINYRQEEYANGSLTVKSWPVMVTGLIYPIKTVYGAIGVGWYNTKFDYSSSLNSNGVDDQTKQKFGWHFGAGVELPLGEESNTRLTADFRYVFLNYNFEEVPGANNYNADFFMITVGLLFGI